jgi:DNA polymerase I
MQLLNSWAKRLEDVNPSTERNRPALVLPKSPEHYSRDLNVVVTLSQAEAMLELARQRPLSHAGFDFEYTFDRPAIWINCKSQIRDPRSIHPLLLSLSFAEPLGNNAGNLYSFVIDLRIQDFSPVLSKIFDLPLCFVGHSIKGDLFCLNKLGVDWPRFVWDSILCEQARYLGLYSLKQRRTGESDEIEEIREKEAREEDDQIRYSLIATCQRNQIPYLFSSKKRYLQASFLEHDAGTPFTEEQLRYAAEDAIAVARLYSYQVNAAAQTGILRHLILVEMPWIKTNAQIEWNGIKVDPAKREVLREACERHLPAIIEKLRPFGIKNPNSHKQLETFFRKMGLLELFCKKGKYSFDKKLLSRFKEKHPAIPLLLAARQIRDLLSDKILSSVLDDECGRIHPIHRQLGTETGRQTCKLPNVLGLHRALRPLIVPDSGNGIGEADWSQIEVGISAAIYKDVQLIEMFNTGDVYSAMAQYLFKDQVSIEDCLLPGTEFKRKHPDLRNRMKSCTLGIIYGVTPYGLSQMLNISKLEAVQLQNRFMEMFPTLQQSLRQTADFAVIRGYATTITGLRRLRSSKGQATAGEYRSLLNYPVQASAAIAFKIAGNRLHELYKQFDARLIVPLHDAFIFEAPLGKLFEVASLTTQIMCEVVSEYFPVLRSKVEINIKSPDCWNKDGDPESFRRWLQDPMEQSSSSSASNNQPPKRGKCLQTNDR